MYNRLFDIDPWKLTINELPQENMLLLESLTSIGNGYMGMRGNFEEGYSGETHQGTYLAGVWFPDKTRVGWWKNGYPQYFGKVINAANFSVIKIVVNGQMIDLAKTPYKDFLLQLDMRSGLLTRSYIALLPGATVRVTFRRFFSIVERRMAHYEVTIQMIDGSADIEIISGIDGYVHNKDSNYDQRFWRVVGKSTDIPSFLQMQTIENSFGVTQFVTGIGIMNRLSIAGNSHVEQEEDSVDEHILFSLSSGQTAVLEKNVAVITDRDTPADFQRQAASDLLSVVSKKCFEEHLLEQSAAWHKRWENAYIEIEGDDASQQGIHFNMFQLFSTYYGEDDRLNIGPKGFTGEKYGGATYWDTEAYILPFYLAVSETAVSEKLLRYRYNQLEGAKFNARQQGLAGALYPMVTFTGVECHNEWEITFEEIHRNGAIAYAIYNYTNYSGDESYLLQNGIDVLVEISRFWADRVHYSSSKDCYMIHGVTGPNEYENNVNNNWYTNYLCRWTLTYTLESLQKIPQEKQMKLQVTEQEQNSWKIICEKMYLPENAELGIFVQHDTFLDKDIKTVNSIPAQQRPINQHWSWDRILRSCFIKQADVLQGIYLFDEDFSREQIERNYDFYEPMTVHESSLSACIHSIIAARLGREEKAMEFYLRTARLDLDNYNNDTQDGLHITSMSGSWLAIVQGFAGMRTARNKLSFAPFCPTSWNGYAFTILYRGRRLQIRITKEQMEICLLSGLELNVFIYGKEYVICNSLLCIPLEHHWGD